MTLDTGILFDAMSFSAYVTHSNVWLHYVISFCILCIVFSCVILSFVIVCKFLELNSDFHQKHTS